MVRELLNYEAHNHKQAETKSKGRRTDASSAVLSVLRTGKSRNDLPPLFNQNSFIMRDDLDKCGTCADRPLTAELIIKDFISQAEMAMFEESLHELFVMFVQQTEDLSNDDYKNNVIYTYTVLRNLIKDVEKLKKLQKS